jgi:hypothetical protein
MGTQGTMKPDSRKLPVALDRARRDVENCGDLFHGKSAEVAQLNHACLSLIFASKTGKCLINGEDFVDAIGIDVRRNDEVVLHLYAMQAACPALGHTGASVIDEDLAHDASGEADELTAARPVDLVADKAHVGLMDEGGGLERVVGALAAHVRRGQAVQLGVDSRQQFFPSVCVAGVHGLEQLRDLTGGGIGSLRHGSSSCLHSTSLWGPHYKKSDAGGVEQWASRRC